MVVCLLGAADYSYLHAAVLLLILVKYYQSRKAFLSLLLVLPSPPANLIQCRPPSTSKHTQIPERSGQKAKRKSLTKTARNLFPADNGYFASGSSESICGGEEEKRTKRRNSWHEERRHTRPRSWSTVSSSDSDCFNEKDYRAKTKSLPKNYSLHIASEPTTPTELSLGLGHFMSQSDIFDNNQSLPGDEIVCCIDPEEEKNPQAPSEFIQGYTTAHGGRQLSAGSATDMDKNNFIENKLAQIYQQRLEIEAKDQEIEAKNQEIEAKDQEIDRKDQQIKELMDENKRLTKDLAARNENEAAKIPAPPRPRKKSLLERGFLHFL